MVGFCEFYRRMGGSGGGQHELTVRAGGAGKQVFL